MSFPQENTMFDFDLDLLNEPSTNNAEPDPQAKTNRLRKSLIFLKQRITKIDKLTVVCKAYKKENIELHNTCVQLKQQCGQQLSEISFYIGKVTKLENEKQAVETREREMIETIKELENKILALDSVINQLKFLEKEHNNAESTPLKVEKKKAKAGVTNNAKKGLVDKEVENLCKDNANILNFEKENEKLRKENARIPNLEKEIENLRKKNSLLSKSDSDSHNAIARNKKLEKEIETLYKENAKITTLEKEIQNLQKENTKILNLEKEIDNLRKENVKIPNLQKEIANLQKENVKMPNLKKEIENLQKENFKISNLEKEIENLQNENVKISNLEKEIENLQKENAKIVMLVKEIEILREEKAKTIKLANENETVLKQNGKILNLAKDIETCCINKALSREIIKIPNKGKDIETQLIDLTSTTKQKGKLRPKCNNLTRKYKSLPDIKGEWTDNIAAENDVLEDHLLSPTRNDTVIAKKGPIADKDIVTRESDSDTGRGSSLANSDTDKGIQSPEYFLNCDLSNGANIENKTKTKDANITRTTRRPSLLEEIETPAITIVEPNENRNACEGKSVSHRNSHSKLMSTVYQINAAREVSNNVDTSENVSPKKRIQSVQEKDCLEMNNRLQCNSHTDPELENIFSTMNLNYNAVSPIPRTPILVHEVDSTSSSSVLNEKLKRCSDLYYKAAEFIQIFMAYVVSQGRDDGSFMINECDKFFAATESISKSEQIRSEHSIHVTNSNMEISNYIPNRMLSHDDNGSESMLNAVLTTSTSDNETEIFPNKKGENRFSQNVYLSALQNGDPNQLLRDENNSVVTISNPSSPDNDTNILRNKQVCTQKQLLNHSVSEELALDREIFKVTDSVRCSRDIVEINQPPIKKSVGKRAKHKKKTKLEKLKKKLKPKYKIKMEPEKMRTKLKQVFPIKKVSVNDTSASLNDKDAYEKAVKVMAEIKSQQAAKANSSKHTKVLMSPKRTARLGKDINSSSDNQILQDCHITTRSKKKFSELFDTCAQVKDLLLLSPRKAKNSLTHESKEDNYSTTSRAKEDNNSTSHRAKEDNNSTTSRAKEDNNSTSHRAKEDNNSTSHRAKEDNNSTSHRAKEDNNSTSHRAKEDNNSTSHRAKEDNNSTSHRAKDDNNSTSHRAKDDNNSTSHRAKDDNNSTSHRAKDDNNSTSHRAKDDNNSTTSRAKEDNNSTSHRAKEDNNLTTHRAKEDINSTTHKGEEDNKSSVQPTSKKRRRRSSNEPIIQCKRVLRSSTVQKRLSMGDNNELCKSKRKTNTESMMSPSTNKTGTQFNNENTLQCLQLDRHDKNVLSYEDMDVFSEDIKVSGPVILKEENNSITHEGTEDNESSDYFSSKKRRRRSSNQPLKQYIKELPSAPIHTRLSTEESIDLSKSKSESNRTSIIGPSTNESDTKFNMEYTLPQLDDHDNNFVSYGDLDVFSEDIQPNKNVVNTDASACLPEESILCCMIETHAREKAVRSYGMQISDKMIDQVCEKIEQDITTIIETNDPLFALNNMVADLRKLNFDLFIAGLMKYLTKPERKFELLGKVVLTPFFPAFTKAEQILLNIIEQLKTHWPDIVNKVWLSIEFTLFKLNRTPEFDVVESASHFYALLCKQYFAFNRLKLFMLDAMYCIQFKSMPLIKQCLEVWKDLIPFPHMKSGQSPAVICFVYLLHFYKCDDKLNRVHEIRNIIRHRYHYQITNWNETKILEMLKNCIKDLKDNWEDKKHLRLTLIILAKRNGPKWCQNHFIKNLLQPMMKENVPNYVKEFCVSMIGPLMKPYPVDMKVECEIAINQLRDILNNNRSPEMEEAAIKSMLYINRHDHHTINKTILSRKMKPMSPELEKSIRNYVKSKPLRIWKTLLRNREYSWKTSQ